MAEPVIFGRTFCQLKCMTDLVTNLSDDQKKMVMDIEFDKLLLMKPYTYNKLPKNLTWWLVSKVDTQEAVLKLESESINIEASVPKLLGLPQGPNVIQPQRIGDNEEDKELLELKLRFSGSGKALLARVMMKDLKGIKDRKVFCQYFVLLALSFYLAPTINGTINRDYLTTIRCVDAIKDFNWCKYVAQYLISSIKGFRGKRRLGMSGCVHILHLIYFDYSNRKYNRTWNVNLDTPLIHIMRQSDLNDLELTREEITPKNPIEDNVSQDEVDADIEMPATDTGDVVLMVLKRLKRYIEAPITTRDAKVTRYKETLLAGLRPLSSEIADSFLHQ